MEMTKAEIRYIDNKALTLLKSIGTATIFGEFNDGYSLPKHVSCKIALQVIDGIIDEMKDVDMWKWVRQRIEVMEHECNED